MIIVKGLRGKNSPPLLWRARVGHIPEHSIGGSILVNKGGSGHVSVKGDCFGSMKKHPSKTRRSPSWSRGYQPVEPHEGSHDVLFDIHVGRHPGQELGHLLFQPGEKENDLLKQQNAIQEKLTEIAKRGAEVYRVAYDKEKELTDRALKLAEVGKPKSNWELQGIIAFCSFRYSFLLFRRSILSGSPLRSFECANSLINISIEPQISLFLSIICCLILWNNNRFFAGSLSSFIERSSWIPNAM